MIAAAETAASWARARRATWTSAPLSVADTALTPLVPTADFELLPSAPPAIIPPAVPVVVPPPAAAPRATPARESRSSIGWWTVRGGIAATVVAAAAIGGLYVRNRSSSRAAPVATAVPAVAPVRPSPAAKATGGLRVTSTPAGAQVLVDGKARGVTPVTLAELSVGRHEVTLTSPEGTLRRSVTVAANQLAVFDEAIFSGFVVVSAPFDLTIAERSQVLRADDRNQVMLPPGVHELRLTNRALGYDVTRRVEVQPGVTTNVQVTPEPSTLTVAAAAGAEVWVDGVRVGETPLTAAPVQLGSHEVVVRRAAGGERRFTVTIGVKPSTLNVEF